MPGGAAESAPAGQVSGSVTHHAPEPDERGPLPGGDDDLVGHAVAVSVTVATAPLEGWPAVALMAWPGACT
jgi:hypothetical protein